MGVAGLRIGEFLKIRVEGLAFRFLDLGSVSFSKLAFTV